MKKDNGFESSAIPEPGVSALKSTAAYEVRKQEVPSPDGTPPPGVSLVGAGIPKRASAVPAHLRDMTDKEYAETHFPKVPYGASMDPNEPQGYIVQIPLDRSRSAPSVVRNGALPQAMYQKHAHYYEDTGQPPARAHILNAGPPSVRNISESEIEDDPRFERTASPINQQNQIPAYTSAGEGKTKRLINKPLDPNHPGEAKVGPGDWIDSKEKQQYDTQRSTKLPWDEFKNPFKGQDKAATWRTDRVEKLASAVGLDLGRYQTAPVWSRSTPPLLIDLIMLGHFGKDWLTWDPETVRATLVRTGIATDQDVDTVFEKAMAVQVLHACDIFWESWGAFEKICLALLGRDIDPQRLQVLTIEDMARAIAISKSLPGLKAKTLSEEVLRYIAAKIHTASAHPSTESRIGIDGLVYLPPPLEAAQPFLDSLQPSVAALVPQVKHAYANGWPVTDGADPLNVQLDRCYRLRAYVQAP